MDRQRIDFLKQDFEQGFPAACGLKAEEAGDGSFVSRLSLGRDHVQQDGFVHAGVMATMADHTAGYAAYTVVSEETRILTVEFKINYFRPAAGEAVVCRSSVISAGRRIIVAESEVFAVNGSRETRVAKALVTLTAVPAARLMDFAAERDAEQV